MKDSFQLAMLEISLIRAEALESLWNDDVRHVHHWIEQLAWSDFLFILFLFICSSSARSVCSSSSIARSCESSRWTSSSRLFTIATSSASRSFSRWRRTSVFCQSSRDIIRRSSRLNKLNRRSRSTSFSKMFSCIWRRINAFFLLTR